MRLDARRTAGLFALGRVGLGTAVLAMPEKITGRWLGEENAAHPVVGDLARGLAARDIALGVAMLVTLGDRVASPRVQLGCALADAADVLGTLAARRHLPRKGMVGTVIIAGFSALDGVYLARQLARA